MQRNSVSSINAQSRLITALGCILMLLLLLILYLIPISSSHLGGTGSGKAGGSGNSQVAGTGGDDDVSGTSADEDSTSEEPPGTKQPPEFADDVDGISDSEQPETQPSESVQEENVADSEETREDALTMREVDRENFTLAEIPSPQDVSDENEGESTQRSARQMRRQANTIDEFGNPTASDAGLAKDGEFGGQSILVWVSCDGCRSQILSCDVLWDALRRKGFLITKLDTAVFDVKLLRSHDQAWIFSGSQLQLSDEDVSHLSRFLSRGKGIYLCSDNAPYLAEGARLAQAFSKANIIGDYRGDQVMQINWGAGLKKSDFGATFEQEAHPLLTGINFLYEGITISHIEPVGNLKVILRNSEKKPLVAIDRGRRNLIVDCGFTRYYPSYVEKTAGTVRYGENIAAWLAGKRGVSP